LNGGIGFFAVDPERFISIRRGTAAERNIAEESKFKISKKFSEHYED